MSDDRAPERDEEEPRPDAETDRVTGDAASAPAAQPRESASDTTA